MRAGVQLYYLTWPILDFEIYTPFSIYYQEKKGSNSSMWLLTQNPDSITAYHCTRFTEYYLASQYSVISGQFIDLCKNTDNFGQYF